MNADHCQVNGSSAQCDEKEREDEKGFIHYRLAVGCEAHVGSEPKHHPGYLITTEIRKKKRFRKSFQQEAHVSVEWTNSIIDYELQHQMCNLFDKYATHQHILRKL